MEKSGDSQTDYNLSQLASNTLSIYPTEEREKLLNAKVKNLEKQLETVLNLNLKLKEENEALKKMIVAKD